MEHTIMKIENQYKSCCNAYLDQAWQSLLGQMLIDEVYEPLTLTVPIDYYTPTVPNGSVLPRFLVNF